MWIRAALVGFITAASAGFGWTPSARAQEAPAAEAPGVTFAAAYTVDLLRNAQGGLRRGNRALGNLDAELRVDAESLFGWQAGEILVSGLLNHGGSFSEDLVGDLQGVSNIDTDPATRLYEAWAAAEIGPLAFKAGLIDFNSEFDVTETGGLFLNGSHGIGADLSQVGENGPSIFPVAGLGVRARMGLGDWTLSAGLFEGVPGDPRRPARTTIRFDDGEGVLAVAEIGRGDLAGGRIAIGALIHTAQNEILSSSAGSGAAVDRRGSRNVYGLAEKSLVLDAHGRTLNVFGRVGFADRQVSQIGA